MFFEILLFCFYSCANTFDLNTFKGAVYEHHVIMPENTETWVNRSFALENMMKNIYVYQKQAIKAGKEVSCIQKKDFRKLHGIFFSQYNYTRAESFYRCYFNDRICKTCQNMDMNVCNQDINDRNYKIKKNRLSSDLSQ